MQSNGRRRHWYSAKVSFTAASNGNKNAGRKLQEKIIRFWNLELLSEGTQITQTIRPTRCCHAASPPPCLKRGLQPNASSVALQTMSHHRSQCLHPDPFLVCQQMKLIQTHLQSCPKTTSENAIGHPGCRTWTKHL